MGHINHCLSYEAMKEMWRKEDEAARKAAMEIKVDFLYKEALKEEQKDKESFAKKISPSGDIEHPYALFEAQEELDIQAIMAGYPTVKLAVDKEGYVITPDGSYFVKEEAYVYPEVKIDYLSVSKEEFRGKFHGRNCTFIRRRYKVRKE